MKDIDFDELDKAVSDVLGAAAKPTADTSKLLSTTPEGKEEAAKSEEAATSENSAPLVTPRTTLAAAPPEAAASVASPAVRRGRFMDVVHPSADMTTASSGSVSKPPVVTSSVASTDVIAPSSRKLAPVSTDLVAGNVPVEEKVAPVDEAVQVEKTDSISVEETVTEEPKLDTIDTPIVTESEVETKEFVPDAEQIVEVAPSVEADNDATSAEPEPKDDPKEEIVEEPKEDIKENTHNASEEDEDLLTVPDELVPDAPEEPKKTTGETEETPTPFLADTKVDKRPLGAFAEEDDATAKPADPLAEPLPRELKPDVLSIESKEAKDDTTGPVNVLDSPENTADDMQLHHMFSNDVDHQPLVAHKTRSSAWIWILLIIALLIVGAGLGYLWFVNGY